MVGGWVVCKPIIFSVKLILKAEQYKDTRLVP